MNTSKLITAANRLKKALNPQELMDLGRQVGFARRLRLVTPDRLVTAVITALSSQRTRYLADILRTFNALTGLSVQYKPFHNQLSKDEFAKLMRGAFARILENLVLKVLEPVPGGVLGLVSDIVIQDGTSFALHRKLATRFPGRFTKVSPAAVEIHATMSLVQDQVVRVSLAPDRQAERDFLPEPADLVGKLLLADRGYADIGYSRRLQEAGAHFIIKFKGDINPLVVKVATKGLRRSSIEGYKLQWVRQKLGRKNVDLDLEWKHPDGQRTQIRFVSLWIPERKERIYLATSLPRELVSSEMVAIIYRLRWQIELVFKEWKSYANLHGFITEKPAIAEGLMWGALAAAALKRYCAHITEHIGSQVTISTQRTATALGYHMPRLMTALLSGRGLTNRFRQLVDYLLVNGRRAHPLRDHVAGRLRAGILRNRALAPHPA